MAVNFSGKRKSEEDLLKKNGMTTGGAAAANQGQASPALDPTNDAAMRIAMAQKAAGVDPVIASVPTSAPSAVYSAGGNTYHSREKKVGTGTATLDLTAGQNQQAAQLPVDSGYAGAVQAAPAASDWNDILMELARRQIELNGQMPTGATGAGGAYNDLYAQLVQQQMQANAAAAQNIPSGVGQPGAWSDRYNQMIAGQIDANAAAMGNVPSGIATGQGAWGQQYDEMIRQQIAANNGAMGNVPTGIATGQGAWGQRYDQLAQQYMSLPEYQKPAQLAGADGQETWNDTLERLAREQIATNNYMPYDPDTYDRMKATWLGKAEIAGNVAAEQARQGAGGYGTSYASQLGSNAYDASMQQSAADYYDQQKAAWERKRQMDAQRLSIAGDMAARETDAQDRANAEALADWQRQRQVAAENMSIAGSMADREQTQADREAQAQLAAWQNNRQLQAENAAYAGEMASREQDQADREAKAQLAAWERQQALAEQNLGLAGEMASREQSAADREAQAQLAAWERQQQLAAQNIAYAGDMADRETAAAQREYENRVNEWNMARQANSDNLSVAGDMAAWDIAQQQAAAEQAQTEADAAYDRVQGLYQTLSQVYDGTNESTVRSQMRNAGYTEDEINNAMNMVKNDMAAAVEDQARNYFGNQSAYDQMANNGVISNEQAVAAKGMDSDNMTRALAQAMSNPASAAQVLGMDESTAAEFAAMDEDSQMNWVVDTAGQMVLDHQINDLQFSQIIQPQVDDYIAEKNGSKHYAREITDVVALLRQYKDAGYIGSDAYGYMMQYIAPKISAKQFENVADDWSKMSDIQKECYKDLLNYMSDEQIAAMKEKKTWGETWKRLLALE